MTTLMALLPVAISGLVGVLVGFHYANKERHEAEEIAKQHEEAYEDKQEHFRFAPTAR